MHYYKLINIFLFSIGYFSLTAQCTYLLYDSFSGDNNTAIHLNSGGTGWTAPWIVQNDDTTVPGYNFFAGSLSFSDLQTLDHSGVGGRNYLTMGRQINDGFQGPFEDYVSEYNNGIGTELGDTLWASMLISKTMNNDQPVFLDFHGSNGAWCNGCSPHNIAVGYFGAAYHVSGNRRWHLRLNDSYYDTGITVNVGDTYLMVFRIVFLSSNTEVSLYVNPTDLGNQIPASPTITQVSDSENIIRSVAVYLGETAGNGRVDELRMATNYTCVTPDGEVDVNLPPLAVVSANTTSGMRPLTVSFDGSASSDPENQTLQYLWDFGDGTPVVSGSSMINHTFEVLGIIPVTLTVVDNLGLQHSSYINITITDSNGTYPCLTRVTPVRMPSCGSQNGEIYIHANGNAHTLYNANGILQTPISPNAYGNLAHGHYSLYVAGNVCTDTFDLFIQTDSTTCTGWAAPPCAMQIGTNMSGFNDWSVERPLKNLFKHIRNQVIGYVQDCYCWDSGYGDDLLFDANGYPTHIPQTINGEQVLARFMISAAGGNLRTDSSYVIMFDGQGVVTLSGNLAVDSAFSDRIHFRVLNNDNFTLNIIQSTLGNHVRNIRLIRQIDYQTDINTNPIYSVFLEKIAPFQVLRYMDWGHTNGNTNVEWANRSSMDFYTYAGERGVPYEMMIKLANIAQKDVWICVPHAADDNYIEQMAWLFKNTLDSNLNIYLEYSNEVWNWIFAQAHYNDQNKPANLSYGRAMAEKAGNVFRIWHQVFNDDKCRVKRVLGLQAGHNSLNEEIVSQLPQEEWDFGSPTHYFGLDHSATANPVLNAGSTVNDVMLNAQNTWNAFKSSVKQDYNLIKTFGKGIISYEGGQHFVGNSFGIPYPYQQAMWDAQISQQMYALYDAMHDTIRNWGNTLAMNFTLAYPRESVYGSWGILEDIDQTVDINATPKYQAVVDNLPSEACMDDITWNGSENELWSNPCNWDKARVPQPHHDVMIPGNATHQPEVDQNAMIKTVTIVINAVLTILAPNTLTIKP